ncbi:MAG: hypothetical protein LH605_10970 [Microbacteriaceae bacterium]|nr:hypothetical protein [Microbacteriaceae bacterium]
MAAWRTSSGPVLISDWHGDDLRQWYDLHGHDRAVTGPVSPVVRQAEACAAAPTVEGTPMITDFAGLFREVERIRSRGFATVDEEFEVGVVAASAPVHDFRGDIVAAINLSAPTVRLGSHLDEVGALLARIAGELSTHLGGTPRGR